MWWWFKNSNNNTYRLIVAVYVRSIQVSVDIYPVARALSPPRNMQASRRPPFPPTDTKRRRRHRQRARCEPRTRLVSGHLPLKVHVCREIISINSFRLAIPGKNRILIRARHMFSGEVRITRAEWNNWDSKINCGDDDERASISSE